MIVKTNFFKQCVQSKCFSGTRRCSFDNPAENISLKRLLGFARCPENMKKKFFFAESKSFKKFSCTLRIQFCQACQEKFAIVLIMFQLMSKTDRVFFLQKIRKMFLWTRKTQFWQTCRKFLNKKPKKVSLNNEDDLNNTIFLKKSFSATSWTQFWLALRKAFSRKGEKLFPQGPKMKQFFLEKDVKFSSGQLDCIFGNPPQTFRPMLWKFYKPVKRFSTTAEKIPPNVGRWIEIYNLFRSKNDHRNVTLDMFTAIWTISLKFFTEEPIGHLEWNIYNTAVNVLTRSDFFSLNGQISFKRIICPKINLQKVFLDT